MVSDEWVNQWPDQKPDVPPDDHGWFQGPNELVFKNLLSEKTSCVIELGSWLGKSTKFIAQHAPNATIYAVDHWKGSPEHHEPHRTDVKDKLATLYETFLVNLWEFKDRVKPLRMTTKEGLRLCYENGVKPDVIHIDAGHGYDDVMEDIKASKSYFPNALLIGDDWNWTNYNEGDAFSVRQAVIDYAYKERKLLNVLCNVWWLK